LKFRSLNIDIRSVVGCSKGWLDRLFLHRIKTDLQRQLAFREVGIDISNEYRTIPSKHTASIWCGVINS